MKPFKATTYIAFTYPYSYKELQMYLSKLDRKYANDASFENIEVIDQSLEAEDQLAELAVVAVAAPATSSAVTKANEEEKEVAAAADAAPEKPDQKQKEEANEVAHSPTTKDRHQDSQPLDISVEDDDDEEDGEDESS